MHQSKKVSIIIPTYNRQELVRDAIQSVLCQKYDNFEIIVVDDCSTDNTKKIIEEFKDRRIVFLKHDKNKGVSTACNTGIKNSTGSYIFILNDDDLLVPWALEKLVKKIEHSNFNNLGCVYGWSWWVDNNWNTFKIINTKEGGDIFDKILTGQRFTNLLIKKEVFSEVGMYDESLRNNEDFDFYLRAAKKYQFDFVPEVLTIIRKNSRIHLSTFSIKNLEGYDKIYRKYSINSQNHESFIFRFMPKSLYVKLSEFKNYFSCRMKLLSSPKLRREIFLIKEIFAYKN